jgi:hypothetical protein
VTRYDIDDGIPDAGRGALRAPERGLSGQLVPLEKGAGRSTVPASPACSRPSSRPVGGPVRAVVDPRRLRAIRCQPSPEAMSRCPGPQAQTAVFPTDGDPHER